MLERRSALAGFHGAAERPGVDGAIGLEIGEVAGWSLTEIGVVPSKRDDAERAIKDWLGTVPERISTPRETPQWFANPHRPAEFLAARTFER